jgi:guanylate kinase
LSVIFIISGPSGSGKSRLVELLLRTVSGMDFSVSYTTRQPRGSERNGRDYFFVSRVEFEHMASADEFLEYADVFGNGYGTARRFLTQAKDKGHDLLVDVDVQGASQLKEHVPDTVSIFVMPPDHKELESRLRNRGLDAEDVIQSRLERSSPEDHYNKYDYVLVNKRLEDSADQLREIVISERKRSSRQVRTVDTPSRTAFFRVARELTLSGLHL